MTLLSQDHIFLPLPPPIHYTTSNLYLLSAVISVMLGPRQPRRGSRDQSLSIQQSPSTPNPDPPFPYKRGYVCHTAWQPTQAMRQASNAYISILVGDEGCVTDVKGTSPLQWVWITVPRRNIQGFVPFSAEFLHIGDAIYGRIKVNLGLPTSFGVLLGTQGDKSAPQALFMRTVYALIIAFSEKADAISLPQELREKIQDRDSRLLLAHQIHDGALSAGSLSTLNQTDFTIETLVAGLSEVSAQDKEKPMIYLQVLWNFARNRGRLPEIRLGKTNDGWIRAMSHKTNISNSNSQFYVAAREATVQQYAIYPLVRDLPNDAARTIFEQISIVMFGAYHESVAPDRVEHQVAIDPNSLPSDVESRNVNNKWNAAILTNLANEVFEQTGWKVATKRASFHCTVGWNITSPFFEIRTTEALIWTRLDVPDGNMPNGRPVKAVFRRSPSTLNARGLICRMNARFGMMESRRSHLEFMLSTRMSEPRPQQSDEVLLSVEIMLNGQRHPHSLGRLPGLGPWSDWNEAAGVAVKVEWFNHKAGQWMSNYIQKDNVWASGKLAVLDENVYGALRNYSHLMAIRRFFLRQTLPAFQGTWELDFGGIARVKKISFSNLTQTITLTDILDSIQGPLATYTPNAQMVSALSAAGARNVARAWPVTGSPTRFIPNFNPPSTRPRTKCDFCYLMARGETGSNIGAVGFQCVRQGNLNVCQHCFRWGHDCSWTPTVVLQSLPNIRQLLLPAPLSGPQMFEAVDDPQLRKGTT